MAKAFKDLPSGTRDHCYRLVTDTQYRGAARRELYGFHPTTDGKVGAIGGSVTKYGYDRFLPPGTSSRRHGDRDPGKFRIACHASTKSWWIAEHVPSNLYKFHKITIRRCATCKGTNDLICGKCRGGVPSASCADCAGKGFHNCPDCITLPQTDFGVSMPNDQEDW